MGYTITAVGRTQDFSVLEFESPVTIQYLVSYGNNKVELVNTTRAAIPDDAMEIFINGHPVKITKQSDRTVIEYGVDSFIFSNGKQELWRSVFEILERLHHDKIAYAKRRSGKTTAICVRAFEMRGEGHTVNIIVPSENLVPVVRDQLAKVIEALYPQSGPGLVEGIVISKKPQEGFDKFLVDELQMVQPYVRDMIPHLDGATQTL